jgi:hypothetical protein
LDEAHHVEDQVHDEDPIEESILFMKMRNWYFLLHLMKMRVSKIPFSPSHEDKGMVSCTPFQVFDFCDASFDDLESEEFLEKPLDLVNFSFDEEHDDHKIENIDDFYILEGINGI